MRVVLGARCGPEVSPPLHHRRRNHLVREHRSAVVPSRRQVAATDGEVRKVDLSAQKVTLKHGDIKNLRVPGMTMVFKVSDPKLLSTLKEGDRVRFTADRIDGALTVTSIEDLSN